MTKDTAEFSQFTDAVACHEHTLSKDEETSESKSWIRGNIKIGPEQQASTCCLHGKHGVEIRIAISPQIITALTRYKPIVLESS